MSLLDVVEEAEKKTCFSIGVCAEPGKALCLPLTLEIRSLFEDAKVPKRVHDLKLALHVLFGLGVNLQGASTTACCSPTRSIQLTLRNRWPMWLRATASRRHRLFRRRRFHPGTGHFSSLGG